VAHYREGGISLPLAIKHQIRKLMFADLLKEAEVIARAEASRRSLSEEPRPAEQITWSEAVLPLAPLRAHVMEQQKQSRRQICLMTPRSELNDESGS
jgi:hypothetical protein